MQSIASLEASEGDLERFKTTAPKKPYLRTFVGDAQVEALYAALLEDWAQVETNWRHKALAFTTRKEVCPRPQCLRATPPPLTP